MGKTRNSANLVSDNNLFIDIENDRVGIGTTTPQYKVDVVGDINFTGSLNQGGSPFVASRWTTGTGDDIFRLNGDVGIGTTNPQYKVDVVGDINLTGTFRQNGSPFVASRWTTGTGDDIFRLNGDVGIGTTNPIHPLQVNSGTNIVVIDSLGEVGIGTTNPTVKLHVIGGVIIVGTTTVTSLVESSSITLKENISPIENALDKILQLNPVTYDRKNNISKNEAGLIAEEVEKIIPNIVSKDSEGNPEGISYTKLTVYLIDAVKALTKELREMKNGNP